MVPLKSGETLQSAEASVSTIKDLNPQGLLDSLMGQVSLSNLEVHYSDFILNVSGILEPGILVMIVELDLRDDETLYAL